jgi:uncharacterized alpha-E superfamily protein
MLSRVADSVFWLSRYVERAENVARFIEVNMHLSLDLGESASQQWGPLVNITGDHEEFAKRYGEPTREKVWQFLTFDRKNPNSILSCLSSARENARTIRGTLPSLLWEELNKFYLYVRSAATEDSFENAPVFLEQVKLGSYLFVGLTESVMSRNEAWHFSRLGRNIERADKTSRILDVKYFILLPTTKDVGTPLDVIQWAALLKSASALEMYRQVRGRITPVDVVEFLMLNTEFPRSIRSCLARAEESLRFISGNPGTTTPAINLLSELGSQFDFPQAGDIIQSGLHEFIDRFQANLLAVDGAIYDAFFAKKPLASTEPSPALPELSPARGQ